jgi:hypothetical protein
VLLFSGAFSLIIGQSMEYLLIGIICILGVVFIQFKKHNLMNPV